MKINRSAAGPLFVMIMALALTIGGFASVDTAYAGLTKKKLTRINSEGAVTVRAAYMNPLNAPDEDVLLFEVRLNTHAVDLDGYRLEELTVLEDDKGNTYTPLGWFNPGGGGHHRFGVLKFADITDEGKKIITDDTEHITLIIKSIDNVKERRFQWTFPLK